MLETQEPKYDAIAEVIREDGNVGVGGVHTMIVNRATDEPIPDDEPIFIFRARDWHAIAALKHYQWRCKDEQHRDVVEVRIADFLRFRLEHEDRMKEPDSQPIYPWPRA